MSISILRSVTYLKNCSPHNSKCHFLTRTGTEMGLGIGMGIRMGIGMGMEREPQSQ